MKKNLTVGLAVLFAAALTLASTPRVNAQGAGLVSSIFNKMERNRRDLRSMRASISMEKYNAQIRDSDKRSGTVAYVPGEGRSGSVRVDWRTPVQEILAVAGGEYTLFSPRRKLAYVGSTDSKNAKVSNVLGFGLNASASQLKAAYDYKDVYNETLWGGVATTHITLVPKGAASHKYTEIWVDGSGMLVQTKVVEKNGDATTVRLMDIQRNVAVSKDEFKLNLGSDVKKVRG
ncbi:MAG TPA: outer membrane lipoprotein carrier protein LolA [Pyrinomonadaceae bacterium]|nr:outer membrane lipoprotein carrier protein LolA [Pyrinomonadaceae bacterium]